MKSYTFKYQIGQVIYFKTDKDQNEYLLTGIVIDPYGHYYLLSNAGLEYKAYELEITSERNTLLALGVEQNANT